jgi:transposase-like protein
MITKTLLCPSCGSERVIRYGKDGKGTQRYRCHACAHTFREHPGTRAYSEKKKAEILATYQERTSLRGLTRIFGVSRTTVTTWLKKR